jgi:hypothetical protein
MMKVRLRLGWLLGGCGIVLATTLALWLAQPNEPIDRESSDRALKCTSRADVIAVIGKPHFSPGKLPPDLRPTLRWWGVRWQDACAWQGHDFMLYIWFDDEGNATDSYWKACQPPPPDRGLFNKLRRWFRLNF